MLWHDLHGDALVGGRPRERICRLGHEHVALRVVHRHTARSNLVVGGDDLVAHLTSGAADPAAAAGSESVSGDIVRMDQHDVATRLIAVEIFFLVDNGVELAFAANRHQLQRLGWCRQLVSKQRGLTVSGREGEFFLSLDSRITSIDSETKITVKKAPFHLKMVQIKKQTFLKTLREKLLWGQDLRN